MINIGLAITNNEKKFLNYKKEIKDSIKQNHLINIINVSSEKILYQHIKDLNILLTYSINTKYFNKRSNQLKWIQIGNAGVDDSLIEDVIKSKIIITNSRGINAVPVAEYVISTILYFSKNFSNCISYKKEKVWRQWEIAKKTDTLENQTIGIIGYGAIGKEIAKRAKAFNMQVLATRRLQKAKTNTRVVNELLPLKEMDYIISNSNYLIITCPLTPRTKKLINKNNLSLMPENSYLINVSRGEVLEEKDLIEHLKNNKIKGAALDVFSNEPLNKNSELFNLNNTFLSPHIAGNFKGYQMALIKSFIENLNRYLDKKSLKNRVCKKRLY